MKLSKEKIKKVLLANGLSTRRSERIAEDLASSDLTEEERSKRKSFAIEDKDVIEVEKE